MNFPPSTAFLYIQVVQIGHVNEYPTMHDFGNPRHAQSMLAYIILTEYFWIFQ